MRIRNLKKHTRNRELPIIIELRDNMFHNDIEMYRITSAFSNSSRFYFHVYPYRFLHIYNSRPSIPL